MSPPHDEVLLFRQKDPKPLAPGRGPSGSFAPVPTVRAAELAALRQSSPYNQIRHWGAATPAGAMRWRGYNWQRITTRSFATLRMTDWEKQIPRFARNDNLEVDVLSFIPVARGMGPSRSSRRIRQAFMGNHSLYIHQSLYLGSWTTLGIVIGLVPFLNSA